MSILRFICTLIGISCSVWICTAKEKPDTVPQNPNTLKVALSTGNNIIQNGRKMNTNAHYLMPAFSYFHHSGCYVGASLVYMFTNKKPLDNLSMNIGYDKDFGENITIGIDYSYSKYFSTKQVKSGVPHTLTLSGLWYNTIVTPAVYAYYTFGSATDITLSADLTHSFIFKNILTPADKISIPVVFGAYMGTLNFYNEYVKKNPESTVTPTTYPTRFGLTSIFCTASLRYRIKSFGFGLTGTYNAQFNAKQKPVWAALPIYKLQVAYYF